MAGVVIEIQFRAYKGQFFFFFFKLYEIEEGMRETI